MNTTAIIPIWLAALALPLIAEEKPNVLLIVVDDLGWGELSSQPYHKDIPTPHIDSIGTNGIRFTNGYVSGPYCSPTRAGLLTGRYQQRFGHEFNPGPPSEANTPVGLDLKEKTWGDYFKSAGYTTGWFGKSHLGHAPEFHPLNRGFDQFYGFLGGAHGYFDSGNPPNQILHNRQPVSEPGYLTKTFAREASKFIEAHQKQPWLVYLPFNAVHAPLDTLKKYDDRFKTIADPKRRKFAALLSALDDSIGTVLAKVRELGLEENTIIYFISDNGGPTPSITSSNGPLKGYKAQTSEGGIRVPFAIQWKGKIPSGKVIDTPVIQLDLLPTSLAAAGIAPPPEISLDGLNLIPFLTGKEASLPERPLFWRFGSQFAIRKGDWKLVKSAADQTAKPGPGKVDVQGARLYNLRTDLGEKVDLASKHPEKVKELSELWVAWNSELVDPKWTPGELRRNNRKRNAPVITNTSHLSGPWKSGDQISGADAPAIAGHPFRVSAKIDGDYTSGVILAHGGSSHGYTLHLVDGKPTFSIRSSGTITSVSAEKALSNGSHTLVAILTADNKITLELDQTPIAQGEVTKRLDRQPGEGLTVGNDGGAPVGDYNGSPRFTGRVLEATVTRL